MGQCADLCDRIDEFLENLRRAGRKLYFDEHLSDGFRYSEPDIDPELEETYETALGMIRKRLAEYGIDDVREPRRVRMGDYSHIVVELNDGRYGHIEGYYDYPELEIGIDEGVIPGTAKNKDQVNDYLDAADVLEELSQYAVNKRELFEEAKYYRQLADRLTRDPLRTMVHEICHHYIRAAGLDKYFTREENEGLAEAMTDEVIGERESGLHAYSEYKNSMIDALDGRSAISLLKELREAKRVSSRYRDAM